MFKLNGTIFAIAQEVMGWIVITAPPLWFLTLAALRRAPPVQHETLSHGSTKSFDPIIILEASPLRNRRHHFLLTDPKPVQIVRLNFPNVEIRTWFQAFRGKSIPWIFRTIEIEGKFQSGIGKLQRQFLQCKVVTCSRAFHVENISVHQSERIAFIIYTFDVESIAWKVNNRKRLIFWAIDSKSWITTVLRSAGVVIIKSPERIWNFNSIAGWFRTKCIGGRIIFCTGSNKGEKQRHKKIVEEEGVWLILKHWLIDIKQIAKLIGIHEIVVV